MKIHPMTLSGPDPHGQRALCCLTCGRVEEIKPDGTRTVLRPGDAQAQHLPAEVEIVEVRE